MKADSSKSDTRDEYDFADGFRGKYAERFAMGSNVVVLDPDIAAEFKTPQAVNDTLRAHLQERRRATGGDGVARCDSLASRERQAAAQPQVR
ncbi:MAG: hypothetical protein WD646_05440 [Actinomycetota bacterium]